MKLTSVPKDYRPLLKAALAEGWTLTRTAHGRHPILTSPDGSYSTPLPGTSTCPYLLKVIKRRLRNQGLEL